MKQPNLWKSFGHAASGLAYTVRTQRNARIHLVAAAAVIAVGLWLGLDSVRWSILALLIGAMWVGETINTAVEATVDLLSPEFHERAKVAKDVSAGAVLLLALTALAVGLLLLGPPLWQRLGGGPGDASRAGPQNSEAGERGPLPRLTETHRPRRAGAQAFCLARSAFSLRRFSTTSVWRLRGSMAYFANSIVKVPLPCVIERSSLA